jgi:hypothetical protein
MNNRIFDPENELETALIKATKDMNYWSRFYKIFLKSDIFVIINKELPSEEKMYIVTEKTEVEFIARKIGEKACLPIFSSLTRLNNYIGNNRANYIKIGTKDLLESIDPSLTVMLNLNSAYGKEFTPEEIKRLIKS